MIVILTKRFTFTILLSIKIHLTIINVENTDFIG